MGVDMNVGTEWPFGGPQIMPDIAAGRLLVKTYAVEGGQRLTIKITSIDNSSSVAKYTDSIHALTAYGSNREIISIVDKVSPDGQLNWTAPAGQ